MTERDPLDEFFWREDEEAEGLPDLASPVAAAEPVRSQEVEEWLTFRLGAEEYAVAIGYVREVLKAPAITEVPRVPPHVLGVIMVRGEVIAVLDPRIRLDLPPGKPSREQRVLICDAGEGPRGLLVDAVSQVVRLGTTSVEPRPNGVGGLAAEAILGIGREENGFYVLLDLPVLLGVAEPEAAP